MFLYEDCGSAKGCFGMPKGCVTTEDCEVVISYAKNIEQLYKFEIQVRPNWNCMSQKCKISRKMFLFQGMYPDVGDSGHYVALGLSTDTSMGSDSVMSCSTDGVAGYWNTDHPQTSTILDDPSTGLDNEVDNHCKNNRSEGGKTFCRFRENVLKNI